MREAHITPFPAAKRPLSAKPSALSGCVIKEEMVRAGGNAPASHGKDGGEPAPPHTHNPRV